MVPLARTFLSFLLILVAVTCFVPSARADSVQFSFKVDPVGCVFAGPGACSDPIAGSGIFSVIPTQVQLPQCSFPGYRVTAVLGQINGYAMTLLPNLAGPCD